MRQLSDIIELLERLDQVNADDLEAQDLDFKEWTVRSMDDSVRRVVEMAVCMANGGGGTVVIGVSDKKVGRKNAILGVPDEVDVNRMKRAVYDSTDPKITPVFEELQVPEGTGCLLVMQVHPGIPPYSDSSGSAKIRIGADCQPLTGSLRRRLMAETGESDVTSLPVEGRWQSMTSPAALEKLRATAAAERAPRELLELSDEGLLEHLGCLREGQLTRAGLLLCGSADAIHRILPAYVWTFLRMASDTHYSDRQDGTDSIPVVLGKIEERINFDNPIDTLELGLIHAEVRAYPQSALREVLLNALCHADFRLPGPILVKQFPDRLEISNPGTFIGGISPSNILHHPPVPRNPALVDALARLRLVNRSNLGIGRMFEAFLIDGKEPPVITESGETVIVTFQKQQATLAFRSFVSEQAGKGHILSVDELLIIQYLLRHTELETSQAAILCQRPEASVRETLSRMERKHGYLERGGTGRGTYWTLARGLASGLLPKSKDQTRIDWEAAKTRVLSILKQRTKAGEPGLGNAGLRQITAFDRRQVARMMRELREQHPEIRLIGERKNSRYVYEPDMNAS